jgi:hypothetical protein
MRGRDVAVEPRFFLAALSKQWAPRVVAVSRAGEMVGLVYAKEWSVAGIRSGIVFIDGRLGPVVLAGPRENQEEILGAAVRALFGLWWVHGLRFAIVPGGEEAHTLATVASAMGLDHSSGRSTILPHARLTLPGDHQQFLQSVGSQTRRSFLRFRRKFEAAGHTYLENLQATEVRDAVGVLRLKSKIPSTLDEISRAVNVFEAVSAPWAVGLKHRDGRWLSVAGGWRTADGAAMFFQLNNDREEPHASLSLVLRGYLIETLIGRGARELLLWAGSSPPLSHYAESVTLNAVHLDRPTVGWRFGRSVIEVAAPWISRWVTSDVTLLASPKAPADLTPVTAR